MRMATCGLLLALCVTGSSLAGPITPPPGPVASTPGPEPRVAINAVNTPGDADSLYRITEAGSYLLTGNLTGVAGKHGIQIASNNVTVDLNGFAVAGVASSLSGIHVEPGVETISVQQGVVFGWGGSGVEMAAASDCIVENVIARGNDKGFRVGEGSIVRNCKAITNSGPGIEAGKHAVIKGCTSEGNGTFGIQGESGTAVTDCTARENGLHGIRVGIGGRVQRCQISSCDPAVVLGEGAWADECVIVSCTDGVLAGTRGRVTSCRIYNSGWAISADGNCVIRGNVCTEGSVGVRVLGSGSQVEDNVLSDNTFGVTVTGPANLVVRNVCNGNDLNWNIFVGNQCLIIEAIRSSAVLGDSGGTSTGAADTWSNLTN